MYIAVDFIEAIGLLCLLSERRGKNIVIKIMFFFFLGGVKG